MRTGTVPGGGEDVFGDRAPFPSCDVDSMSCVQQVSGECCLVLRGEVRGVCRLEVPGVVRGVSRLEASGESSGLRPERSAINAACRTTAAECVILSVLCICIRFGL